MLNKTLRTDDTEGTIEMEFVIRDLHQHIEQLHSQQEYQKSFIVYRGQGKTQPGFDKINNNKAGLLFFNNFLSTSTDRQVSSKFAGQDPNHADLIAILFEMKIDLSQSTMFFAYLDEVNYYGHREKVILIPMRTIFRIVETEGWV